MAKKNTQDAVDKLAAIAHEGRLKLMRRLIKAGDAGMAAGDLARFAGVSATTASAQLQVLGNADLVSVRRSGRMMIYAANYQSMRDLLRFLMEDCCADRPEICGPLKESVVG